MNLQLFLDTTSPSSVVALVCNGQVLSSLTFKSERLAEIITLKIDELFRTSNYSTNSVVTLNDVKDIIVATGPGSFTGTRTGIAIALGIASGISGSVQGICSLYTKIAPALLGGRVVIPCITANANEKYSSVLKLEGCEVQELVAPTIINNDDFLSPERLLQVLDLQQVCSDRITLVDCDGEYREEHVLSAIQVSEMPFQGAIEIVPSITQKLSHYGFHKLQPLYVKNVNAKTLIERGLKRTAIL